MTINSGDKSLSPTYAPVDGIAKVLVIVLIIQAAAGLVGIYFAVVETVNTLPAIVSFVLFLIWFHRAYKNLPSLGASELRFTPRWAVIWWFIPILNFWKPYQVTVEIMKSSDPIAGKTDSEARKRMKRPNLILIWWVFQYITLVVAIAAGISNALSQMPGSINSSGTPDLFSLTLGVMVAIDIWLTILVIREISKRQSRKIEIIRSGGSG